MMAAVSLAGSPGQYGTHAFDEELDDHETAAKALADFLQVGDEHKQL